MATAYPVLNDLLQPLGDCITPEVAQRIVDLRAPASVQKRVEQLAAKSSEGTLDEIERQEYEALVSSGNFIAILQSKARTLLKNGSLN
jgi:hypothetical protein